MSFQLRRAKTEAKVLALLTRSKSASLKILPQLKRAFFSDKNHRVIFEVVDEYWKKYMSPPKKVAIIDGLQSRGIKEGEIDRFRIILDKMANAEVEKSSAEFYTEKVIESYKARKLLRVVNNSIDLVERGKIKDAMEHVQLEISRLTIDEEVKDMSGDYISDFKEREKLIMDRIENPEKYRGIPTGIKQFDNYYGGLLPQELGIIVAGTGKGKSIALMNFAFSAYMKGYDVVIFTIEMSKLEYEFRIDSRASGNMHRKYRMGTLDKLELEKWKDKIKEMKGKRENKLHIIDVPEGCTTNFIEMKLLQMKDQLPKNFLLVVDYLNIMFSSMAGRNDDDWKVQGYISRELKMLCRSWNIPCWTAAQSKTKAAVAKMMSAEDTGRSYGVPQNANIVLGLIQTREMELDGVMKLVSLKGRDGKMPDVNLHPDLERMRLHLAYLGNQDEKKKEDKDSKKSKRET